MVKINLFPMQKWCIDVSIQFELLSKGFVDRQIRLANIWESSRYCCPFCCSNLSVHQSAVLSPYIKILRTVLKQPSENIVGKQNKGLEKTPSLLGRKCKATVNIYMKCIQYIHSKTLGPKFDFFFFIYFLTNTEINGLLFSG